MNCTGCLAISRHRESTRLSPGGVKLPTPRLGSGVYQMGEAQARSWRAVRTSRQWRRCSRSVAARCNVAWANRGRPTRGSYGKRATARQRACLPNPTCGSSTSPTRSATPTRRTSPASSARWRASRHDITESCISETPSPLRQQPTDRQRAVGGGSPWAYLDESRMGVRIEASRIEISRVGCRKSSTYAMNGICYVTLAF